MATSPQGSAWPAVANARAGAGLGSAGQPPIGAGIHRHPERFSDHCLVKPGLTGRRQVARRNRLSHERRTERDCLHVWASSLRADASAIVRTMRATLHGSGY